MNPEFKRLLWDVPESEYRNTGMHYSHISDYIENGFRQNWEQEKKTSTAFNIGSAVDCILTNPEGEFEKNFIVCDMEISPRVYQLRDLYPNINSFKDITSKQIVKFLDDIEYCKTYSIDKRIQRFAEKFGPQFDFLKTTEGKTVLSKDDMDVVTKCVDALRSMPMAFFWRSKSFKNWEVLFQAKIKFTIDEVEFACMFDVLLINHYDKLIYPCDLKTCTPPEWDFIKNFKEFHYDIQARLYSRGLQEIIENDPLSEFSDYRIMPFRFIVCSKQTFTPIWWEYTDNLTRGTITYNKFVSKDPVAVAVELQKYITEKPKMPYWIDIKKSNDLTRYL